jgi:hypothetical protein
MPMPDVRALSELCESTDRLMMSNRLALHYVTSLKGTWHASIKTKANISNASRTQQIGIVSRLLSKAFVHLVKYSPRLASNGSRAQLSARAGVYHY